MTTPSSDPTQYRTTARASTIRAAIARHRAAKTAGNDEAAARWILLAQHHLDRHLADLRVRHS